MSSHEVSGQAGRMAVWMVGLAILGLLAWWLGRRLGIVSSQAGWRWATEQGVEEHSPRGNGTKRSLLGDCQLIFKPSALALALLKNLGKSADLEAQSGSWKTWPSLQTVRQLLWPPDHLLEYARDFRGWTRWPLVVSSSSEILILILQVADDGLIALDWVVGPLNKSGQGPGTVEPAVLLVAPNAAGKITRNICQLCQLSLEKGYYPVIFNRRGHNGCPLTSTKLLPFGDPSDLKEAVTYIRFWHPTAMLFAVSENSGLGLLLSYLGECGSSCNLRRVACLSPLLRGQDWFKADHPWLCEWTLLLYQKRAISRYAKALREAVEMERVLSSRSLKEFEEALFCRGKSQPVTWEAYWGCDEPLRDADDVAVPVLCLCSADDPVRGPPSRTLPWELFHTNPHFFLLLAPHGGHCGFLRKSSSPSAALWGNMVALEFLGVLAKFFQAEEEMRERPRRKLSATPYQQSQGALTAEKPCQLPRISRRTSAGKGRTLADGWRRYQEWQGPEGR